MLGKTEGRKRRGQQRMRIGWHHRLNGHEFEQTLGDREGQGSSEVWHAADHAVAKNWTQLSN